MKKKIYYQLGSYQGHRIPGVLNIECLKSIGAEIVDKPACADIVILHDEPWNFPRYFMIYPEMEKKYLIAYSVWETDVLPELYRHNLDWVDEIWTASHFCQNIFNRHYKNVHVIPHVINPPVIDTGELKILKRMIDYDDGEFCFYTITKVNDPRKNFQKLLRLMPEVLRGRRARFIAKTDAPPPWHNVSLGRQFVCLPFSMSGEMIHALHHIGFCYVSPHCAEGWGLCLSDAMAHGNLVVATSYGGNMEFMSEENSLLVRYQMVPAQLNSLWPADACQWAAIDDDDLITKLRSCVDHWEQFTSLRNRSRETAQRFRPSVVAGLMEERLRAL